MAGPDGAVTTGLPDRRCATSRTIACCHTGSTSARLAKTSPSTGTRKGTRTFTGGGDRVRYSVAVDEAQGPFRLEAELWFQPIAYRWAMNLKSYDAAEPKRFVEYYESSASGSGVRLASASAAK